MCHQFVDVEDVNVDGVFVKCWLSYQNDMFGRSNGVGLPCIIAINVVDRSTFKFTNIDSSIDNHRVLQLVEARLESSATYDIYVALRDDYSVRRLVKRIEGRTLARLPFLFISFNNVCFLSLCFFL